MIILRSNNNKYKGPFEKKLEGHNIYDYEVSLSISRDNISVTKDLSKFKVYFPLGLEYNQYEVSDLIRLSQPGVRTNTEQEYDMVTLSTTGPITEATFFKVLKKIIENEGFVTIVDESI